MYRLPDNEGQANFAQVRDEQQVRIEQMLRRLAEQREWEQVRLVEAAFQQFGGAERVEVMEMAQRAAKKTTGDVAVPCFRCLGQYPPESMKWSGDVGGHKCHLCDGCFRILAQCGYCGGVSDVTKFNPHIPSTQNCTQCGTMGKQPLSAKQAKIWKPKSNLLKQRSESVWTGI